MAEDRKEILKGLLKKLHEGANPEQIKEQFKKTLGDVPPTEIAAVEEELIKDGMPGKRYRDSVIFISPSSKNRWKGKKP